jgi:hypothetical protein
VSDIRNDAREFAPRSVVRDLASALEPWRTMIVILLACGCDTSSAVGESLLDVAARSTIPVGRAPNDVVLGDVDADGRLDIVISNGGSSDLTLLLGREGRRFDRSSRSRCRRISSFSRTSMRMGASISRSRVTTRIASPCFAEMPTRPSLL